MKYTQKIPDPFRRPSSCLLCNSKGNISWNLMLFFFWKRKTYIWNVINFYNTGLLGITFWKLLFCINRWSSSMKNIWTRKHCLLAMIQVHRGSAVCSGPQSASLCAPLSPGLVVHTQASPPVLRKPGFQSTVECWGFHC